MKLKDYRFYKMSCREYLLYGSICITAFAAISYLFYYSFFPVLIMLPVSPVFFRQIQKYLCLRQNNRLCRQFKDTLVSLSASLESGCSFENAIWDAYLEICVLYSERSYMAEELKSIYNQLKLSIPIEEAFSNLAARTCLDDITVFCDIIKIAKRTDGNIISVIRSTSDTIEEKYEIRRQIQMNINGRKFEQLIMAFMPMFIIIYIKFTTPDFFAPLYHNLLGIIFVTVCLIFYGFSIFLSAKITRIEV